MMNSGWRYWMGIVAMMALAGMAAQGGAQEKKEKRAPEKIIEEINKVSGEVRGVLAAPEALFDAQKRAQVSPKLVPALKKMVPLFVELAEAEPEARAEATQTRFHFLSLLSLLGDEESTKTLKDLAEGTGPEATLGKASLLVVRWWKEKTNPAEQAKALEEIRTLALANAQDPAVRRMLNPLPPQAASKELATAAEKLIDEVRSQQKPKILEGKPLVIEGIKLDGGRFSTAGWKGKVVLVDFWATWCGPCVAELPKIKKIYKEYHSKGLEIVGISSDEKETDLTRFLDKHKDMTWPQLFDAKKPGWHPLATEYGVEAIPTLFLIDRKGILRSVEAGEDYEKMIPRLLEEK